MLNLTSLTNLCQSLSYNHNIFYKLNKFFQSHGHDTRDIFVHNIEIKRHSYNIIIQNLRFRHQLWKALTEMLPSLHYDLLRTFRLPWLACDICLNKNLSLVLHESLNLIQEYKLKSTTKHKSIAFLTGKIKLYNCKNIFY